ncbi:hypothetical protein ES319_D04G145800v1 [Gossypium barbadense]|uniref:Ternary complex factor MIP1 leucine-zipper domain-containing protein n=2 Tax=Gossypium TaxID=3633 RepID=A0A5J5RWI2_GOSBA|nr:hypothetical protein ES319_D04G145800v1 [Gossypium barbadense]TYG74097.1 hypothetical protein ES288_D04G155400v1 [Gossypium darwinii]TYG74098.1 hypothetical protein ES288_D04G155400v1 [Gossypium darwinii]TYG74099.1 hypothetical protein ES288_D04G155400v1 [Gossypium darwinii]
MEARFRRGQKKSPEEANQMLQMQAWKEEVERARQGQRDAESKLSSLEAEVQKLRVEMAAMKRDAEHYSRQVFQRRKMLRIDGLCKKMGYKDAKLLMLYGGRSSINRYLQWKSGKVWSKSFLAGGDSCNSYSELEVKKLQQQLQKETDLHLALASAVQHYGSPSSSSPGKLPDKAQELLDSIAILEITVAKLQQALHQGPC